jgi:uncharacterized protein (DUF4415 family)
VFGYSVKDFCMPTESSTTPRAGRPKGKTPPKRTTTVRLDQELLDWINENVPRNVSISAFVNEAVREKIELTRKP